MRSIVPTDLTLNRFCNLTPAKVILFLILGIVACQKELSLETNGLTKPADKFRKYLTDSETFRLSAFYSEVPVDFDPNDTIPPSTNLWMYVPDYLRDDTFHFLQNNICEIVQGPILIMPGTPPTFNVAYDVRTDTANQVFFDFVNYQYQPNTYHLESYNDTSFTVSEQSPNGTLFTRYRKIP